LSDRDPIRNLTRREAAAIAAIGIVAVVAVVASVAVAPGLAGLLGAALALDVIAIAAIDARRFIIPDELTLAALVLGMASAGLDAWPGPWSAVLAAIGAALLRGAVLAGAFFALRAGYARLRGREGIGLGDVKLAGAAGVWLAWSTIPVAIEIAALAALAVYVARHFAGSHVMSATARMPFGLFLAPAIWLGWLLEATLFADRVAVF
jgi:leader peptidase (prepilin peptidase)/N-methyltransferase